MERGVHAELYLSPTVSYSYILTLTQAPLHQYSTSSLSLRMRPQPGPKYVQLQPLPHTQDCAFCKLDNGNVLPARACLALYYWMVFFMSIQASQLSIFNFHLQEIGSICFVFQYLTVRLNSAKDSLLYKQLLPQLHYSCKRNRVFNYMFHTNQKATCIVLARPLTLPGECK